MPRPNHQERDMTLQSHQIEFIRHYGYLHLGEYKTSTETDNIHRALLEITNQKQLQAFNRPEFYEKHKAVNITFDNPHQKNPILMDFATGLNVIADSILQQAFFHMSLIQHNQAKKNHSIPWHQDIDPQTGPGKFFNFLFYPHDCTEEMGGLRLVPQSHRFGALPAGGSHEKINGEITIYPEAGDLLIVDGLTFHAVPQNQSTQDRISFCSRFIEAEIANTPALNIGRYRTGSYNYAEQKDVEHA
jgi:hypothetical protein